MNQNELYHYNHNHDALGRFAKSSGVSRSERLGKRKERLENRSMRYEARIASDKERLSRPSSLRRDAKVAKLERKKNRYAPRAAKAQKRLAKGKDISNRQAKAMLKTQQLEGKIAKADKKNSKVRARVAKNELRNARVEKRIARVSKMQLKSMTKEIQSGKRQVDFNEIKKRNPELYKIKDSKKFNEKLKEADLETRAANAAYSNDIKKVMYNADILKLSKKEFYDKYGAEIDKVQKKYGLSTKKR